MKRGFYYCKPHEVTYLLLAWKHNEEFRAGVNKDLLPLIVSFLKEYISIAPLRNTQFTCDQEKWIGEWITKQKTIIHTGITPSFAYLYYALTKSIPDYYTILVIVCSSENSVSCMINFVRAYALFNVQVVTLETMCVDPNTFDFIFADNVKCDFSPRGKFLCIHQEGEE